MNSHAFLGILALCPFLGGAEGAPAGPPAAEGGPLGLVLSGGGAKGAYEVGVWRELQAAGLAPRVAAISGTSVGAINAALFAAKPDAVERLWLENMGDVFTLSTNRIAESVRKTIDTAEASKRIAEETGEDWRGVAHFVLSTALRIAGDAAEATLTDAEREGYIDSSRLAAALDANLPTAWPAGTPAVYATAVEKNAGKASATWRLDGEPRERQVLMLRASSAIPFGFDTVRIDGRTYVDGGWDWKGGDNVPIGPILANHPDIRTVVVVFLDDAENLSSARRDRVRNAAAAAGVRLVEILPSEDIGGVFGWGGIFDASTETARHLIDLGRADARKALAAAGPL